MFWTRLFKKDKILLNASIEISETSSIFSITHKSNNVTERELILLGLLIYARILRVESHKPDRDALVENFIEIHKDFKNASSGREYMQEISGILSKAALSTLFRDTVSIRLKKETRIFLDMDVISVHPLSSVVYTIFNYLYKNLNQKNTVRLIEGFALLSNLYQKENFTILSAVGIPNMIVYEIMPFNDDSL